MQKTVKSSKQTLHQSFSMFFHFTQKEREKTDISKHNLECASQVIFLMITDGEKYHYLAMKSLFRLLYGIASNHDVDYYCMNCLYLLRTESKLKSHENVRKDRGYCHMRMPEKDDNILTESLYEKIHACDYNPEESCTAKISKHTYNMWIFIIIMDIYTVHSNAKDAIMIFTEVLTA